MESWKDITGMEGFYKVSNLGQVASCDREKHQGGRQRKGRILKLGKNSGGQVSVKTMIYGELKQILVSRLVAGEFIRPLKNGEMVYHLDHNKENNKVENLFIAKNNKEITKKVNHLLCDDFEKIKREDMTQEKANEYLYYSEGELFFRKKTALKQHVGKKAGFLQEGFWRINLCGETYMRARIIYLMHTGKSPEYVLHKDENPLNDRIENLYEFSAPELAVLTKKAREIYT